MSEYGEYKYRILWDYGQEGFRFESTTFKTAFEALEFAMDEPKASFFVVKIITFEEKKDE